MGYDATAYAILGVKLNNTKDAFQSKKVKAFKHDFPDDFVVCPRTGRKLFITYDVDIFKGEEGSSTREIAPGISFFLTDSDLGRAIAYIGLVVQGRGTNCYRENINNDFEITVEKLQQTKQQVEELVAKFNLKASPFGLWAALHESY